MIVATPETDRTRAAQSPLTVVHLPLAQILDLEKDRKDRTTKAYQDHEYALMLDIRTHGVRNPIKVIATANSFYRTTYIVDGAPKKIWNISPDEADGIGRWTEANFVTVVFGNDMAAEPAGVEIARPMPIFDADAERIIGDLLFRRIFRGDQQFHCADFLLGMLCQMVGVVAAHEAGIGLLIVGPGK